jgi:hypothetical protein
MVGTNRVQAAPPQPPSDGRRSVGVWDHDGTPLDPARLLPTPDGELRAADGEQPADPAAVQRYLAKAFGDHAAGRTLRTRQRRQDRPAGAYRANHRTP